MYGKQHWEKQKINSLKCFLLEKLLFYSPSQLFAVPLGIPLNTYDFPEDHTLRTDILQNRLAGCFQLYIIYSFTPLTLILDIDVILNTRE